MENQVDYLDFQSRHTIHFRMHFYKAQRQAMLFCSSVVLTAGLNGTRNSIYVHSMEFLSIESLKLKPENYFLLYSMIFSNIGASRVSVHVRFMKQNFNFLLLNLSVKHTFLNKIKLEDYSCLHNLRLKNLDSSIISLIVRKLSMNY